MIYSTLFIADPLEGLVPHHDTTVAMMRGDARAGHAVWFCRQAWIEIREGGRPWARVQRIEPKPEGATPWFGIAEEIDRPLDSFHRIHMRPDPPVNEEYLTTTRLLDLVDSSRTLVVNRPGALRDFNEKLIIYRFPQFMPRTLVTAQADRARRFLEAEGGRAILKPLNAFGGQGVLMLREGDPNLGSILDLATRHGAQPIMVQEYLPRIAEGDRRIFLVAGEPLGVLVRLPRGGDVRANMAAGGDIAGGTITAWERRMLAILGPELVRQGIYLTGLDVIGERVTEINITSPTGIQEIGRFDGQPLEDRITRVLDRITRDRWGD